MSGGLILSPAVRLSLIALVGLMVFAASYGFAQGANARAQSIATRYVDGIDAPLKRMLMPPRGHLVLTAQVAAIIGIVSAAVALRHPALAVVALIVLPLPKLVLTLLQKRRRELIESKLDGFALSLANATRATPSVGRELQMLQTTLPKPIDREVEQVLREMRVGSSLDQALLNFSWRVQSPSLDALLSAVLIARRIGGRLPDILETTASTLREMARLDGVLRAKTAEARMQVWVMAFFPLVVVFGFNAMSPGYFDAMTEQTLGLVMIAAAVVFWVAAILLARKIMAVEL
jgi:tight adherence protein B